jgi:ribosomal protein S18 acetylase RimI-like enzyme
MLDMIIRRTNVDEAEDILNVQKEAFQADLEKYEDFETSPATEPIKKLLYKINKNIHYTILINDRIIGGAEVRLDSPTECYINRIFVLPQYQDKGLGTRIMNFIENEYPNVMKWTLSTPHKNHRNQHFYEKFGYKKVGEHKVTEELNLIDYMKKMERAN